MKTLLLLLVPVLSYSQVYKFKSEYVASRTTDAYGTFSEWSEWKEVEILIVTDIDEDEITIYSKTTQEFSIISNLEKNQTDEYEVNKMLAIDQNGQRCHVHLLRYNSGTVQLYVKYSDVELCYQLRKL